MKEQLWCCIGTNFKNTYYDWYTLSYTRRDSIKKAVGETKNMDWKWHKKKGWKCIKVTVEITPLQ